MELSHKDLRQYSFELYPAYPPSVASMILVIVFSFETNSKLPVNRDPELKHEIIDRINERLDISPVEDQDVIINIIRKTGAANFMMSELLKELAENRENQSAKIVKKGNFIYHIQNSIKMTNQASNSAFFTNMNALEACNSPEFNVSENPYEEKLINMLIKSSKQSTLLIGPPGIGKTSLIRRLVKRINSGNIPERLAYTNVLQLDLKALLSKTKYRGDLESNLQAMIDEYRQMEYLDQGPKPIIYIEELYTVIGAGSCEGQEALNLSNMLKPLLSNKDIILIGDTTIGEFNRYIATDPAFRRRFNELYMEPPDSVVTAQILKNKVRSLEGEYKVKIPMVLVKKTIDLSDNHIINRNQPDKSIDLLEGAVAIAEKEKCVCLTYKHLLESLYNLSGQRIFFNPGIEMINSYREMASRIKNRIIGQDEIIDRVINKILIKTTFKWNPSNGCLCGFMFSGPTGIGKTQLAKEIARELNQKLLHIDMSEHFSINKLLGAPPGFAEAGKGMLTDFLTTYRTGMILIDEAEKAGDPQMINLFLQMLDEGRITSNDGQTFSLSSMIIIFYYQCNDRSTKARLLYKQGGRSHRYLW